MSLYDIEVKTIAGKPQSMSDWKGRTVLIVNVASQCGLTPQYAGLQALHEKYKDKGFAVLGFPCNQFGRQEPGSEAEIQGFCTLNYGVSFPMYAKIDVNGQNAHALYKHLTAQKRGADGAEDIKWNFAKFLVGPDGEVIRRYEPAEAPEVIGKDLEALLK